MSFARFSYTAVATIWKALPRNEDGDVTGYAEPFQILCDYGGDRLPRRDAAGLNFVVKNTIWCEDPRGETGDYILIGASTNPDPHEAGADEIMHIIRYADTFDRQLDDWVYITAA